MVLNCYAHIHTSVKGLSTTTFYTVTPQENQQKTLNLKHRQTILYCKEYESILGQK